MSDETGGTSFTAPHCGSPRLWRHSPKQWKFSRLLTVPPPAPKLEEASKHQRKIPPPRGPAHPGPSGPASPAGLFFFFGAKSLLVLFSVCLGILLEARGDRRQ